MKNGWAIIAAIGALWVIWELKKNTTPALGLTSNQFVQQTVLGPQLVDLGNTDNPTGAAVPGFSQQPVDRNAVLV